MSIDKANGMNNQTKTLLGSNLEIVDQRTLDLLGHYWPPVHIADGLSSTLSGFLELADIDQSNFLNEIRGDAKRYGTFIHLTLGEIYSYLFGYQDGVATQNLDDELEIKLLKVKIQIEREFLQFWIGKIEAPFFSDQFEAASYLDQLASSNSGVLHPLFGYLEHEASRAQVELFLRGEVIRNEVVDDEVALLSVGLQGAQKAVAVANLWDECGRGRLENFHTFWLRRLATAGGQSMNAFIDRRELNPWFAKITSNMNNMLLTRPANKQMAYGCFFIFESWVKPHFRAILGAMDRLGIMDTDSRIYFDAHIAVDPRHSSELSDGVRLQFPKLTPKKMNEIVRGAHLGVVSGCRQYDYWLEYFRSGVAENN